MAALMTERRRGTTAIRRSRPRRLDLGLGQVPTDHGEASAQAIKANGNGGVSATVTELGGGTPARSARGLAAYPALLANKTDAVQQWGH